jgi:GNAT superfamily N-acetyltransferase
VTVGPHIGTARADEAWALGAILSDWVAATPWMPRLHSREDDAGFVAGLIAAGQVRTARDPDGRAVGFAARDGHLLRALYVAADRRGDGVGCALLTDVQAAVTAAGGPRHLLAWTFAANADARRFYARAGFTETGGTPGDNDEDLPDILLEWRPA